MDKPTPKYELVIRVAHEELHIYPSTPDADQWIVSEAPAFGKLDDQLREFSGMYLLQVPPVYDCAEVALYLARMGGEDTDASLVTSGTETLYPIPPIEPSNQPS